MADAQMWDQRYAEHGWPTDPDPLLVEMTTACEPASALDLGCGTGRHALWLARRGWQVTGVDASTVGLRMARSAAEAAGVSLALVEADLEHYRPERAAFDLVLLANVHPLPARRASLLAMAAGALRPGGHLLVLGHHLDNAGRSGPPDPERLFTVERLQEALPPWMTVERLERVERQLGEATAPADVAVVAWLSAPAAAPDRPPAEAGPTSPSGA